MRKNTVCSYISRVFPDDITYWVISQVYLDSLKINDVLIFTEQMWNPNGKITDAVSETEREGIRCCSIKFNCILDHVHGLEIQYWSLLNWRKIRFRCGSVAVPVNWKCVVISPCFAIFKNVVNISEPGETPGISRLLTMYNALKYRKIL